jgi:Fe2+ transport system protein FeoA
METVKLSACKQGYRVRIKKVEGEGLFKRRLSEMGLLKDTEIYIQKYAPLKDPMELVIKGYHLSLRVEEADKVLVHVLKSPRP